VLDVACASPVPMASEHETNQALGCEPDSQLNLNTGDCPDYAGPKQTARFSGNQKNRLSSVSN